MADAEVFVFSFGSFGFVVIWSYGLIWDLTDALLGAAAVGQTEAALGQFGVAYCERCIEALVLGHGLLKVFLLLKCRYGPTWVCLHRQLVDVGDPGLLQKDTLQYLPLAFDLLELVLDLLNLLILYLVLKTPELPQLFFSFFELNLLFLQGQLHDRGLLLSLLNLLFNLLLLIFDRSQPVLLVVFELPLLHAQFLDLADHLRPVVFAPHVRLVL